MIRLYLRETQGVRLNWKASMDPGIRERYEAFLQKLAAVFESGIRKKTIKPLFAPYYMAVAFDNLTNTFLFLWLDDPEKHPYSENMDAIVKMFCEESESS